MVGVNVFAADTDAEARRLFTSLQQQFISLRRGTPGPLPPPVDDMDEYWSPMERAGVEQALAYSVVGTPNAVEPGLKALIKATDADELMLTAQIYDHTARLRSFQIAAEAHERMAARHEAVSVAARTRGFQHASADIPGAIRHFHRVNIPQQATQPVQLIEQMQNDRDALVVHPEIHLEIPN
jgi:hypothetical protein